MRAEALIEANNLTDEVYTLINKVRQRVGMPTIRRQKARIYHKRLCAKF